MPLDRKLCVPAFRRVCPWKRREELVNPPHVRHNHTANGQTRCTESYSIWCDPKNHCASRYQMTTSSSPLCIIGSPALHLNALANAGTFLGVALARTRSGACSFEATRTFNSSGVYFVRK